MEQGRITESVILFLLRFHRIELMILIIMYPRFPGILWISFRLFAFPSLMFRTGCFTFWNRQRKNFLHFKLKIYGMSFGKIFFEGFLKDLKNDLCEFFVGITQLGQKRQRKGFWEHRLIHNFITWRFVFTQRIISMD